MSRTMKFCGAALAVLLASCETPTMMQQQKLDAPGAAFTVLRSAPDANGCSTVSFATPGTGLFTTVAGDPQITFGGWQDTGLGAQLVSAPGTVSFSRPADAVTLEYGAYVSYTLTWDLADASTQTVSLPAGSGATVSSPTGAQVTGFTVAGSNSAFFLGSLAVCAAPVPSVLTVPIDIKPGSDDNPVNLKSKGKLTVAILSTADFDATTLDVSTVRLGHTSVVQKKNGTYQAAGEDVDGDGVLDLVVHFDMADLVAADDLADGVTELTLTGTTADGTDIQGTDAVTVLGH